jgi:hypothetical protein
MEEKKKRPLTKKQKAAFERRRRKGYEAYLKKLRKEIAQRKREEKKKKEREKKKKEKARLKKLEEKKKRRVGRPKKRGPKKKRRKKVIKEPQKLGPKFKPPYIYKIISCRNGIQNKFIGKYRTIEDAYTVFNDLKEQDKNVIFQCNVTGVDILQNAIDEYILIEKNDCENTKLRNEYGKLVEQVLNVDGWVVLDKFRYKIEETFWVFGYDNRSDRKTFSWIYENLVYNVVEYIYDYKRILTYKNKVVIKHDNGHIDLIFTKSPSDAIRFYNKLEEWAKKDKIKQILFIGDYSSISEKRRKLEDELVNLTGWPKLKIQMKGTTYYMKNKNKK